MLKRLIFAVFVLGIVLSLCGTAISDIGTKEGLNPVMKIDPTHDRYGMAESCLPQQPTFKKPETALIEVEMGSVAPIPPVGYFCDYQGYYDPAVTTVYIWSIPDDYGDDLFNTRFTVDAGLLACTLKVGWILMYGPFTEGTPDMRIYLWDDDGYGFPGNKLDSVDLPYDANWLGGFFWAAADWTNGPEPGGDWVFYENEEYHIGWTTLGDGVNDILWCCSDQATGPHDGEERSSEFYGGMWGSMLNDWLIDVIFLMESERCCSEVPFSDCYSLMYATNLAYLWPAPHPSWGDEAYSMRFTPRGPDTLVSVDIAVYNDGSGLCGNDDIYATLYADDGLGLPGAQIGTPVTVPAGGYAFYPAMTNFDFGNIVMDGSDFHIAFSSAAVFGTGDYECCLSSDGTDGVGRSCSDWGGGNWYTMLNGWGTDYNFLIAANLCMDPYNVCGNNYYYMGLEYFWRLPDAYGDIANAQKIKAIGEDCHIEEVSWALYDNGDPDIYTYDSKVSVYSDVFGLPGAELGSVILTPADYVMFPGMTTVDFTVGSMNVHAVGAYWVAIESFAPTPETGILTLSDAGGSGFDDCSAEIYVDTWEFLADGWGLPSRDWAFVAESYHCCIPPDERICADELKLADAGWSTINHDMARTGASLVTVGDAECNMNRVWYYEHPTNMATYSSPVIYEDKVICAFENEYKVFDLATGNVIYTLSGSPLGDQIRCAPTVAVLPGYADPMLFVSGGFSQNVAAYNLNTGTIIWQCLFSDFGMPIGGVRWGTMTLVDVGTQTVVYYGTDDGNVCAVDALTGTVFNNTNYPGVGWATNPVSLGSGINKSGTTDGANLFYATTAAGANGDIFSISAATGVINWQLSSTGGLQGTTIYPTEGVADEGFTAGIGYQNNTIFANSNIGNGAHPADAVFYSINSGDGSLNYAVPSARTYYSTASLDVKTVYQGFYSRWVQPPIGGNMAAFDMNSGATNWIFSVPHDNNYLGDLVLTCEPEMAPDLIFAGGHKGMLSCINSLTGDELYWREINYGAAPNSRWNGGALGPEGELIFSSYWGGLYMMMPGADRPRLEIQTYNPSFPVNFGSNPAIPCTVFNVFMNTGCTDLTFGDIYTDETCTSPWVPDYSAVRPDVLDNAMTIAARLTSGFEVKAPHIANAFEGIDVRTADRGVNMLNAGAMARPAFLSTVTDPDGILFPTNGYVLAPGASADIIVDIVQPLINRGPQYFCAYIPTDDPDYYLNQESIPGLDPCLAFTVVGGCLIDTTYLSFGMGCANVQCVTNTGRLGTGDWDPHGFDIDGDDGSYYQGSYLMGTSQYSIAMNTQDWTSGGGETDAYISMQPDPNYVGGGCHPTLVTNVVVGHYNATGVGTYDPIYADVVYKSFVDSVQNFNDGSGWDWTWFAAPFDVGLTMGLYTNSRTIGVCDFLPLKDLTLEIFEITERNGALIPDWKFGSFHDYDIGNDLAGMDASISTGFVYNRAGGDVGWGQIKIPFGNNVVSGTDTNPLKNIRTMYGYSGLWDGAYYDLAYAFMCMPPGATDQGVTGDEQAHITLAEHDFVIPNETYTVGVVNFGLHGLTDPSDPAEYAEMAHFVNKWAGFDRGDVNNDNVLNFIDVVYLNNYVNYSGPGPILFEHLGDVNDDGNVDNIDVVYMWTWYVLGGPNPIGNWIF